VGTVEGEWTWPAPGEAKTPCHRRQGRPSGSRRRGLPHGLCTGLPIRHLPAPQSHKPPTAPITPIIVSPAAIISRPRAAAAGRTLLHQCVKKEPQSVDTAMPPDAQRAAPATASDGGKAPGPMGGWAGGAGAARPGRCAFMSSLGPRGWVVASNSGFKMRGGVTFGSSYLPLFQRPEERTPPDRRRPETAKTGIKHARNFQGAAPFIFHPSAFSRCKRDRRVETFASAAKKRTFGKPQNRKRTAIDVIDQRRSQNSRGCGGPKKPRRSVAPCQGAANVTAPEARCPDAARAASNADAGEIETRCSKAASVRSTRRRPSARGGLRRSSRQQRAALSSGMVSACAVAIPRTRGKVRHRPGKNRPEIRGHRKAPAHAAMPQASGSPRAQAVGKVNARRWRIARFVARLRFRRPKPVPPGPAARPRPGWRGTVKPPLDAVARAPAVMCGHSGRAPR